MDDEHVDEVSRAESVDRNSLGDISISVFDLTQLSTKMRIPSYIHERIQETKVC